MTFKPYLEKLKTTARRLNSQGFFHIMISSSLVKVASLLSAMFLPDFMSRDDFGVLTFVDNIRGYILLFNGIGIANATLRYCALTDDKARQKGIFLATLKIGIAVDAVIVALSAACFFFIPFSFGSNHLLLMLSLFPPLLFLLEDMQLLFRPTLHNRAYSASSLFYAVTMVGGQVILCFFMGLDGVVLGRYLAVGLSLVFTAVVFYRCGFGRVKSIPPSKDTVFKSLKLGITFSFSTACSLMLTLNEGLIISQIVKDKAKLADYGVAIKPMQITIFITQSLLIFVFPYFTKHLNDTVWLWRNFKKMMLFNAAAMIPLHILIILLTKPVLVLLYGQKYISAVPVMQTIMLASLVQTVFRAVPGNLLVAAGKEKFNLIVNIIFLAVHFGVSTWAISNFGINGAAIALCTVYFLSGALMIWYFRRFCKRGETAKV